MAKLVTPGDEVDMLRLGDLCAAAAEQLAGADPDPRRHRIDLYRPVVIDGRTLFVRVKLTVAFVGGAELHTLASIAQGKEKGPRP
jgi:hypothetical protein